MYVIERNRAKGGFQALLPLPVDPQIWNELNLWERLPVHPNIVPFDRVVVDDLKGNKVSYTSIHIPGSTFDENRSRVSQLKWLQQLLDVVDLLSLKYGIIHQDVAPRNLLIHSETDDLLLFDLNHSCRAGPPAYGSERDDLKGVTFTLYEIITLDSSFRSVDFTKQDLSKLQELNWVRHLEVPLERPASEYRALLDSWLADQRQRDLVSSPSDRIDWPGLPTPPLRKLFLGDQILETNPRGTFRCDLRNMKGAVILDWEWPPRKKGGDRLITPERGRLVTY